MGKLFTYLKYEGFFTTVKKCISCILGKIVKSETVFFKCSDINGIKETEIHNTSLKIVMLNKDLLEDFKSICFFEHISVQNYLNANNGKIFMGYLGEEPVAYIAVEYNKVKQIHGLGCFELGINEAWVGPEYVKRKYRSIGINRDMLKYAIEFLFCSNNIHSVYTCINAKNIASIKSNSSLGFSKKGCVLRQNNRYINSLADEVKEKFLILKDKH